MKRKLKIEKPEQPSKNPKTLNEEIKAQCELVRQQAVLIENLCRETYKRITEDKIKAERKKEEIRIRRLTHPNLPEQEYRPYAYCELKQMIDEYEGSHPLKMAFLLCGINGRQEDIDFYYGGDISKAIFYPTELNWLSFTLIIDGKLLNNSQREINNLNKLESVSEVGGIGIPDSSSCIWHRKLFVFTQRHKN